MKVVGGCGRIDTCWDEKLTSEADEEYKWVWQNACKWAEHEERWEGLSGMDPAGVMARQKCRSR